VETTDGRYRVEVIRFSTLQQFWRRHADSESSLRAWYQLVSAGNWSNLMELRATIPHADAVDEFTVFNLRGNRYRLITRIDYQRQRIYVRALLTHAEYDKNRWRTRG
jgi:mRNA interferase HigB